MATLRADRRLYVTADRSQVVEEGDPRGAFLLIGEGGVIGEGDVMLYGLSMQGGRVVCGGTKRAAAAENKMAAPAEDKGAAQGDEAGDALPPWTLKSSPADYLERHPDGPNAELAQRHCDASPASG